MEDARECLVIPSLVLVEIDYWARTRLRVEAFVALLEDVRSGALAVEDLNSSDYGRVGELVRQYQDFPLGFVDASVIAVVERLGERKVATLDRRHFAIVRTRHAPVLTLLPVR